MRRRSSELEMGVLRSSLEPAPGAGAAGLCQRSPDAQRRLTTAELAAATPGLATLSMCAACPISTG